MDVSNPVQTKSSDYACRPVKSRIYGRVIANSQWILRTKHRYRGGGGGGGGLIQSPSKRQHTFALISGLQWSSWTENTHKCTVHVNNSTGRTIMNPVSKYMAYNHPGLFVCLFVCCCVGTTAGTALQSGEGAKNKAELCQWNIRCCSVSLGQLLRHRLTCPLC